MLNQRDSAFLVAGMILASLLDNFTTVFLIVLWLFVHNEPMPQMLGGVRPQEILGFFFRLIIRPRSKKTPPPEEPKEVYSENISQPSNTISSNLLMDGRSMLSAPMIIYGSPDMQNIMTMGHMMQNSRRMVLPIDPRFAQSDGSS